MSMLFHSTRGLAPEVDIKGVAMAGLAPDGGLYLPKVWPQFSAADLADMRGCTYQEIAFRVLWPFMKSSMPEDILRGIIDKAYAPFDVAEVVRLHKLNDSLHILELFHGPTLAFKDIALQFLGHVFEYYLSASDKRMTVIGATSGDTGSAAIAALMNRKNIDVFILYPDKGPSDIQRKQMTCVDAPNIHAVAIESSFDDCQAILKALFADKDLREELNLSTVNSINLLRILAQMVYYFAVASQIQGKPSFVVPTGNFGDIYAAYAAMKCGLPISRLVIASNSNDSLTRFFETGRMSPHAMQNTLSPSMDIQVSSNFERLLFDLCGQDAAQVRTLMDELKDKSSFTVSAAELDKAKEVFVAGRADDKETLQTIGDIHRETGIILDPHTAVGVKVAQDFRGMLAEPVICLATAHGSKFPETVYKATHMSQHLPAKLFVLMQKPERRIAMAADTAKVATFIKEHKKL